MKTLTHNFNWSELTQSVARNGLSSKMILGFSNNKHLQQELNVLSTLIKT